MFQQEWIGNNAIEAGVELILEFRVPVVLRGVDRRCRWGCGGSACSNTGPCRGGDGTCTCSGGYGQRTMISQIHFTAAMLRTAFTQTRENVD